jgi:hypothetical protein
MCIVQLLEMCYTLYNDAFTYFVKFINFAVSVFYIFTNFLPVTCSKRELKNKPGIFYISISICITYFNYYSHSFFLTHFEPLLFGIVNVSPSTWHFLSIVDLFPWRLTLGFSQIIQAVNTLLCWLVSKKAAK